MYLLSIIVPAYNVELYLERCVSSFFNQGLNLLEFEVIIVNDGSTDCTKEVALKLVSNFTNVRLLEQSNKGLSAARNSGLKLAQGEFILFVDSDDYLVDNTLGEMLEFVLTNQLEIGIFSQQKIDLNGRIEYFKAPFFDGKVVRGEDIYVKRNGDSACKYLIKLDFLIINGLFFNEDAVYFEDAEWGPRVFSIAERCGGLDILFYVYEIRRGSLTTSNVASLDRTFNSYLLCANSLKEFQLNLAKDRQDFLNQAILKFVVLPFFMIITNKELYRFWSVCKLVRSQGFTRLNLRSVKGNSLVYGRLFNLNPILLLIYLSLKLFLRSRIFVKNK